MGHCETYISSRGEMKISLREITWTKSASRRSILSNSYTHILVLQVLQQLQLSVGSFRQHGSTERLHDLLDRDILTGEVVFGRATNGIRVSSHGAQQNQYHQNEGRNAHQTSPNAPIPTGWRSEYLCDSKLALLPRPKWRALRRGVRGTPRTWK